MPKCVTSKNKDILLHDSGIIVTIRKLYFDVIRLSNSWFTIKFSKCPVKAHYRSSYSSGCRMQSKIKLCTQWPHLRCLFPLPSGTNPWRSWLWEWDAPRTTLWKTVVRLVTVSQGHIQVAYSCNTAVFPQGTGSEGTRHGWSQSFHGWLWTIFSTLVFISFGNEKIFVGRQCETTFLPWFTFHVLVLTFINDFLTLFFLYSWMNSLTQGISFPSPDLFIHVLVCTDLFWFVLYSVHDDTDS